MSFVQTRNFPVSAPPLHRASGITWKSIERNHCTYIIAIPAVGADPQKTWGSDGDHWLLRLHKKIPNAVLLQYDHLKAAERRDLATPAVLEGDAEDEPKNPSAALKDFRLEDWTRRFLETLEKEKLVDSYNVLIVCHSTGGIVLKEAISHSSFRISRAIKAACVLLAFLATPHHGSKILSDLRTLPAVREALGLQDVIGAGFATQMKPFNHHLEDLNQKFSYDCVGIPLWTYGEQYMTKLKSDRVLELTALGILTGSSLPAARQSQDPEHFVVEPASSEIKNIDHHVLLDEEEWVELKCDHMGTARLADSEDNKKEFVDDVEELLKPESLDEYRKHRKLLREIFTKVDVEEHLIKPQVFGGKTLRVDIESTAASLQAFLEPRARIEETVQSSPINILRRFVTDDEPANEVSKGRQVADARRTTERRHTDNPLPLSSTSQKQPNLGLPSRVLTSQSLRPSAMPRRISVSISPTDEAEHELPFLHSSSVFAAPSLSQAPMLTRESSNEAVGGDRASNQGETPQISETPELPAHQPEPFKWYHIPHCVPSWVPLVMNVLSTKSGRASLHKQVLKEDVWLAHHNNPTHDSFHGSFVHPHAQALMPRRLHSTDELLAPSSAIDEPQFALYLPYLHWDTFDSMRKRTEVIDFRTRVEEKEKNVARGVRPVLKEIMEASNLEHKVIWQYLTSEIPMHCRRTLDQYGYPSLRNTHERDGDQVLYKYTKSIQEESPEQKVINKFQSRLSRRTQKPEEKPEPLPLAVLMVDTLWLWILKDDTILTFAPRREAGADSKKFDDYQADPIIAVLKSLTVERRAEVNDCFDLAALIIFYCVEALLKGSVDSNLKVFRIFEGFTSDKVEEQTASYKSFRRAQKSERAQFDNGDDLNNLLELRDISDELDIIEELLEQQQKQIDNIVQIYEKKINLQKRGRVGTDLLKAAKTRLKVYAEQVGKLSESSNKAQDNYDKLLNLKEAHSGVLEARTASEQARIVNIFTVVTIVFSPLSFFTGVFGMNVVDWSGIDTNLGLYFVLKVTLSISLTLIAALLLAAFNNKTRKALKFISKRVVVFWDVLALIWEISWIILRNHKEIKRVEKEAKTAEPQDGGEKLWQGFGFEIERGRAADDAEKARPEAQEAPAPEGNGTAQR